jgi:hypothetical protein
VPRDVRTAEYGRGRKLPPVKPGAEASGQKHRRRAACGILDPWYGALFVVSTASEHVTCSAPEPIGTAFVVPTTAFL